MKNICSSFFSVLLLLCLFQGYVSAQNSYVLSGLSELTAFTSETTQEVVEDLTVIEPEGSEAIPESEIFKLADRVKQITGTLTLEGLTQLTTTIGLIDRIDCSQAGLPLSTVTLSSTTVQWCRPVPLRPTSINLFQRCAKSRVT